MDLGENLVRTADGDGVQPTDQRDQNSRGAQNRYGYDRIAAGHLGEPGPQAGKASGLSKVVQEARWAAGGFVSVFIKCPINLVCAYTPNGEIVEHYPSNKASALGVVMTLDRLFL